MPELPEVELVACQLRELIVGRTILKARLLLPALAPDQTPQSFARRLQGDRVDAVGRRGKHLLIHLDRGITLIAHLRMTGRFLDCAIDAEHPRHTNAIFWLDSGRKLLFVDQRHFARMQIVSSRELSTVEPLRHLAPEPFDPTFDPTYLYQVMRRSNRAIKLVLLDQTRVLGLGNIYAAEALFRARINPRVRGARLSLARTIVLHREIVNVLNEAIDSGSAPYTSGEGHWRVYDREGEPCSSCFSPIKRFSQAGRSTYYCPHCQAR